MNGTPDILLQPGFRLMAQSASTSAGASDALFLALLLLCGAVALALAGIGIAFAIRYRRGSPADRSNAPSQARGIEIAWSVTPLLAFAVVFVAAAFQFVRMREAPADALPVYVVGKQWMWTLQHRNGRREIGELHVPLGVPVELVMTSQDVIHSFFVPAFRLKQDVVPGRYSSLWFKATQLGEFRLFCSEFCGSQHSAMVGRVVVMEPAAFARWLDAGAATPGLAAQGFALFRERGCSGCHAPGDEASPPSAPALEGLLGRRVRLADGRSLVADANYVRDSILAPDKDIVAGYAPSMPSYAGQLSEEQIEALLAWLRSTAAPAGAPP